MGAALGLGRPSVAGVLPRASVVQQRAVQRVAGALERGGWAYRSGSGDAQGLQEAVSDEVLRQAVALLQDACPSARGFALSRKASPVAVGDGVFVQSGEVAPGRVVAFFPGLVHLGIPPEATAENPVAPWAIGRRPGWSDNDKRINLPCGGFIDGQGYEARDEVRPRGGGSNDSTTRSEGSELAGLSNPFALGHLVNHPTATAWPNVVDWPVELDVEALAALGIARSRIPYATNSTWYYSSEFATTVHVPEGAPILGLVFLTTRRLAPGDELLYDYDLGLADRPPWYVARDTDQDMAAESLFR